MGWVPENLTRGFFSNPNTTLTRKKNYKPDPNLKNCKPDPKTQKNPNMEKMCIFNKIYIKFSLKKSDQNFFSKNFYFSHLFFRKFFKFINFEKNPNLTRTRRNIRKPNPSPTFGNPTNHYHKIQWRLKIDNKI